MKTQDDLHDQGIYQHTPSFSNNNEEYDAA